MTPRRPRQRVLVISQYYRPEPNFITADVAEHLAANADVTVITAHPSYPLGRHYASVRSLRPRRTIEKGVAVWRLPSIPDQSTSIWRRALSYCSFVAAAAVCAPLLAPRAEVVWVYNTPFTTAIAALWHRMLGRRVVYTVADLWPESFTASGVVREGALIRALYNYRRLINRLADTIVCSTRGTLETFASEGVPRNRLAMIPVWVETPSPVDPARDASGTPRIVYAGNLGPSQRLETVILGGAELLARGVDVVIDVFGTGSAEPQLRALAKDCGATNVTFHGRVPPAQAFAALSVSAGQVVILAPSPEFAHTVPSKLMSSFAAGAPLLFGLGGEAAEIARGSGGGIEFDPLSPTSFADSVEHLLSLPYEDRTRMRHSLRRVYSADFDPAVLLERYRAVLLRETPFK